MRAATSLRPSRGGLRLALVAAALAVLACRSDPGLTDPGQGGAEQSPTAYNRDWTDATHGNDAAPNYAVVFPQEAANSVEITITPAQWGAVRANMRTLLGSDFGAGGAGGGAPGGGGAAGGGGGVRRGDQPTRCRRAAHATRLRANGSSFPRRRESRLTSGPPPARG